MRRRIVSAVLALVVAGNALLFPLRAQAVLPIALAPGVALVFESGAMATGYATAIGLVGMGLIALSIPSANSPQQEGLRVRINPQADPAPVPAGWTAGANGSDPIPPGDAPKTQVWSGGTANANDACQWWIGQQPTATTYYGLPSTTSFTLTGVTVSGSQATCHVREITTLNETGAVVGDYNTTGTVGATESCPPGYVANGSSCALSQPEQVPYPEDGKCVVKAADGVFRGGGRDPDCGSVSNLSGTSGAGSNRLVVSNPRDTVTVDWNADGTKTITRLTGNGDGTSTRERYTVGPDNKLTGGERSTVAGEGSSAGDSPLQQGSGSACGVAGKPPCTVDDSAFSGKDGFVAGKLGEIGGQLDAEQSRMEGMGQQDSQGIGFDWLPSLKPGPATSCTPLSFSLGLSRGDLSGVSGTAIIDICPYVDVLREVMAWIWGLWAVWAVWRAFTEGNKGA